MLSSSFDEVAQAKKKITGPVRYCSRGAFTAGHPNLYAPKIWSNPCLASPVSSNSMLQVQDGTPTNQSRGLGVMLAGLDFSDSGRKKKAHGCISAPDLGTLG